METNIAKEFFHKQADITELLMLKAMESSEKLKDEYLDLAKKSLALSGEFLKFIPKD